MTCLAQMTVRGTAALALVAWCSAGCGGGSHGGAADGWSAETAAEDVVARDPAMADRAPDGLVDPGYSTDDVAPESHPTEAYIGGGDVCDAAGGPAPSVPTAQYLLDCMRPACCYDIYFDPDSPVSFYPYQIEWTASATEPLPPCVEPADDLLIVRATWRDVYAVPGACAEAPCGGHCHPTVGKVYMVDTAHDRVRYLGDEDTNSWGPPIVPTPVLGGWELAVSPQKTYVFHMNTPVMGTCDGVPCLLSWAVCFIEVKGGPCLHVPLDDSPGPCPLSMFEYARDNGQCATW